MGKRQGSILLRRRVFARDRGICAKCLADCEKIKRVYVLIMDSEGQWKYSEISGYAPGRPSWEVDHVKELMNGGGNELENLQTLCLICHMAKHGRFHKPHAGSVGRPPKGKPLTFRPIRLDDDVWAECQRLGKEHGTINEGLRTKILLKTKGKSNEKQSRSTTPT